MYSLMLRISWREFLSFSQSYFTLCAAGIFVGIFEASIKVERKCSSTIFL